MVLGEENGRIYTIMRFKLLSLVPFTLKCGCSLMPERSATLNPSTLLPAPSRTRLGPALAIEMPPTSIQQLLKVPTWVILRHVRNRREGDLLMQLGRLSQLLDIFLQELSEQLSCQSRLAEDLQHCQHKATLGSPLVALGPLVVQAQIVSHRAVAILEVEMNQCLAAMAPLMEELGRFVEQNESLAQELELEGVHELALHKRRLSETEALIQKRLRALLRGDRDALLVQGVTALRPIADACAESFGLPPGVAAAAPSEASLAKGTSSSRPKPKRRQQSDHDAQDQELLGEDSEDEQGEEDGTVTEAAESPLSVPLQQSTASSPH
ncbi:unnamed protein product [Chrysoparadoxa australica]